MHRLVTGWDAFATVAGGAGAALLGLLFVAVSIRIDVIAASTELRNRTAQTLSLFGVVLLIGIGVAIPAQQRWVVGLEMVVLALGAAAVLYWLDRRAERQPSARPIAHILDVATPNVITCVLLLASGVLLLAGISWGMSVVVAATATASIGGIASTWLVLVRLSD